jgi:hypothetical protein
MDNNEDFEYRIQTSPLYKQFHKHPVLKRSNMIFP